MVYCLQTNTPAFNASVSSSEKWDNSNPTIEEKFVRVNGGECEEQLGGSRRFLLLCRQLSYSHAAVPGENSHLTVDGASPSQAGCDSLCLLAMCLSPLYHGASLVQGTRIWAGTGILPYPSLTPSSLTDPGEAARSRAGERDGMSLFLEGSE